MIDLSTMSQAEIQELIQAAKTQEFVLREQQYNNLVCLVQEVKDKAQELGADLAELFGFSKAPSNKTAYVSKPRYVHPDNPNLSWSGRGKKPGWLVKLLESGERSLADFEVTYVDDATASV